MLMLPSRNPPLWPGRALRLERTILTGCGPVTPQHLAVFFVSIAIRQSLPSWTAIGVLLRQIRKVLLTEAPVRFGPRRLRLGQSYRDAGLVAREDLQAAEVAAIGNGFERLSLQNTLRLLGHIGKLCPISAGVRYLMRHNQMMLGIDGDLHVVADDAGTAPAGCHRTAVGIGQ